MDKENHEIKYAKCERSYFASSSTVSGNNYAKKGEFVETCAFKIRVPTMEAMDEMAEAVELKESLWPRYDAVLASKGEAIKPALFWGMVYVNAKWDREAERLAELLEKLFGCRKANLWVDEAANPTVTYSLQVTRVKKAQKDGSEGDAGEEGK